MLTPAQRRARRAVANRRRAEALRRARAAAAESANAPPPLAGSELADASASASAWEPALVYVPTTSGVWREEIVCVRRLGLEKVTIISFGLDPGFIVHRTVRVEVLGYAFEVDLCVTRFNHARDEETKPLSTGRAFHRRALPVLR